MRPPARRTRKTKRLRQDLNPQPQDSYSCALIPIELRSQTDFGFPILDFGKCLSNKSKSKIVNLKSKIELAEGRGLEPLDDCSPQLSRLLPHQFGLPSVKNVRSEGGKFIFSLFGNLQARSDLNGELRFWRPTFCRLKLRASENFRFAIADLRFFLF
jgi:hypothetical protein